MADFDDAHMKAAEAFKQAAAHQKDLYEAYHRSVLEEAPFDKKYAELMALTASCAIQCEYCIATHSMKAKARGATPKEIAFAIHLATIVKAGATMSYGVEALKE